MSSQLSQIGKLTKAQALELQELKIAPVWFNIAKNVGYQQFLEVWQLMEAETLAGDTNRLYVPKFSSYQKLQFSKVVHTLLDEGKTTHQIYIETQKSLGQTVKIRKITEIKTKYLRKQRR